MKKINLNKVYKLLFVFGAFIYIVCTFVNQQKILNIYKADEKRYITQIEQAKNQNSSLIAKKNNANSKEYIEEMAREKLNMYLPNERVYIDIGK